jgi:hypothetical protein
MSSHVNCHHPCYQMRAMCGDAAGRRAVGAVNAVDTNAGAACPLARVDRVVALAGPGDDRSDHFEAHFVVHVRQSDGIGRAGA